MPYPYTFDQYNFGYGAISGTVQGADGAWYGVVAARAHANMSQGIGPCPFRTEDLDDPGSYRGWNGSAFVVKFADPYLDPTVVPQDHRCEVLGADTPGGDSRWPSSHSQMRRLVLTQSEEDAVRHGAPIDGEPRWNRSKSNSEAKSTSKSTSGFTESGSHPSWIISGDYDTKGLVVGFQTADDPDAATSITSWSDAVQPLYLQGLSRYVTPAGEVIYPTLLDSRSPELGRNSFDIATNSSTYLYLVANRNIWRHRVTFSAEPPIAPPTPLPPPSNCTAFTVRGAGQGDVNGKYSKTSRSMDGVPVFEMDGTHALYREEG